MSDYIDARELLPEYKQIPCSVCDTGSLYVVSNSRLDEWFCGDCRPNTLDMSHLTPNVEVNL